MRTTNNKAVRAFFRWRGYAIGTLLVAFIIYSSCPKLNFVGVLTATAIAFIALAEAVNWLRRSRLPADRR